MKIRSLLAMLLASLTGPVFGSDCPIALQGELTKLRSDERIDLCQFAGKPLLIVNTASHCGFTPQFKGLEALYQKYKAQGLEVIGVPSNDFNQEDPDLEKTAEICYVNYGVTFTMTEPQPVTGDAAIPLFKDLSAQSSAPRWNFYKYVVSPQGKVLASFSSRTKPDDKKLQQAIEQAIALKP